MPLAVVAVGGAAAADSSFRVVPRVAATEVYSSNRSLASGTGSAGWISSIAPGIAVDAAGAKVKGYLDYQLNSFYYSGDSPGRDNQHRLSSMFNVEAVDNWLQMNAVASIYQRQRSTFDPQATSSAGTAPANQGEARFVQLSPYMRGQLFSAADYLVRYSVSESQADIASVASTRVDQVVASLTNQVTTGRVGWNVDLVGTRVNNDIIGVKENLRDRESLLVPLVAHLRLTVSGGRERTNYASSDYQTTSTPGVGIHWAPSLRTSFVGLSERRFFGRGHSWLLSHRSRSFALSYSDVKDVSVLPTVPGGVYSGAIYDLMNDLLLASNPDPGERTAAVRSRLDRLGMANGAVDASGATTSRLFIDRTRQMTLGIIGTRSTVALSSRRRDESALDATVLNAGDDFSLATRIRERGASLSLGYRLRPNVDLAASLLRVHKDDHGESGLSLDQDTVAFQASYQFSPKAAASMGVQRSRIDSTTRGAVTENAVAASLVQRF